MAIKLAVRCVTVRHSCTCPSLFLPAQTAECLTCVVSWKREQEHSLERTPSTTVKHCQNGDPAKASILTVDPGNLAPLIKRYEQWAYIGGQSRIFHAALPYGGEAENLIVFTLVQSLSTMMKIWSHRSLLTRQCHPRP